MPFGKVADFLDEVLPLATKSHASTVRNRTLRVGKRLLRSPDTRSCPPTSGEHLVIGLDGAYVRNRHPRPERTFEVVAGQIRGAGAKATRFAFVRRGSQAGAATITQALREHGVNQDARITVLSDGDAGLRAIQRAAVPGADHVLDWFHIAMRWQHVHQLATGAMHHGENAETRTWLLNRIERAKWALWNGQLLKTLRHLSDLRVWTWNARADPSWLEHLRTHLSEMTHYLDANADSLPNYGALSSGRADFDRLRRIGGERDCRQADDQATTDAVEPRDRPAVPDRSRGGAERHARAGVPVLAHRLQTGRGSIRALRGVSTPQRSMLSIESWSG
jgi:hypothetical protein